MVFQVNGRTATVFPAKSPVETGIRIKAIFQCGFQHPSARCNFTDGMSKLSACQILPHGYTGYFFKKLAVINLRITSYFAQFFYLYFCFQILFHIVQRKLYFVESIQNHICRLFVSSLSCCLKCISAELGIDKRNKELLEKNICCGILQEVEPVLEILTEDIK